MTFKFQFLFIPLLFVFINPANATEKLPFTLGLKYQQGFLLNHAPKRTDVKGLSLTPVWGLEASIQFQTTGSKDWHRYYKKPEIGLSLMYFNVQDKIIRDTAVSWGSGIALIIHETFKIVNTDFFGLNVRLGTGLGYFTKPYNKETNPKNFWISAPINPSMHLTIETRYTLNKQFQLIAGGSFTHFSNGATKMPNLGVNFPMVNVGVRYTPYPGRMVYKNDSLPSKFKKNYFHFSAALGVKVLPDLGTTYYPVYALSAQYGRRIGKISKLVIGIDAFRDQSLRADSIVVKNHQDLTRFGIFGGHEFVQGKLGLLFGLGYYFYKKTERDANTYIKVGLRYHISTHIFAGFVLKTHYGQADAIEWTLGYTL